MGIESRYIWMDGELVPFAEAKVHVLTHTLHYGVGVFEGIRAYRQVAAACGSSTSTSVGSPTPRRCCGWI
jgi:hypothetical protein